MWRAGTALTSVFTLIGEPSLRSRGTHRSSLVSTPNLPSSPNHACSPDPHSRRTRMCGMQSLLARLSGRNCINMVRIDKGDQPQAGSSESETGMTTLIKNGTFVTSQRTYRADLLIENETIKDIADSIPAAHPDRVIDATGLLLLPGGIDVHTHLDMPFGGTTSADDFETGTRAAAFGGTTTLVDFAIQPKGTPIRDALDTWWKKADKKASIDYGLHMIVTDLGDSRPRRHGFPGRQGYASFKLFMAYPGVLMVMTPPSSRPCARLPRTARSSACTLKTAVSST